MVGEAAERVLEVIGLHKWFGEVHALRGVNFYVNPAEVVGLIGDNGAGKSTLIKIVSGILPPDRGRILIRGQETKIKSVNKARQLGIETVFQEQALVDQMSVSRNIFLGRELIKKGLFRFIDDKEMVKRTRKLIANMRLNISSPNQDMEFCSGGERQGAAIVRAMYFQANVIILDEPTRALSPSGVERVQDFIVRAKADGHSILLVTHSMHQVYTVADRFVFMSKGEISREVRKDEISEKDLSKLFAI